MGLRERKDRRPIPRHSAQGLLDFAERHPLDPGVIGVLAPNGQNVDEAISQMRDQLDRRDRVRAGGKLGRILLALDRERQAILRAEREAALAPVLTAKIQTEDAYERKKRQIGERYEQQMPGRAAKAQAQANIEHTTVLDHVAALKAQRIAQRQALVNNRESIERKARDNREARANQLPAQLEAVIEAARKGVQAEEVQVVPRDIAAVDTARTQAERVARQAGDRTVKVLEDALKPTNSPQNAVIKAAIDARTQAEKDAAQTRLKLQQQARDAYAAAPNDIMLQGDLKYFVVNPVLEFAKDHPDIYAAAGIFPADLLNQVKHPDIKVGQPYYNDVKALSIFIRNLNYHLPGIPQYSLPNIAEFAHEKSQAIAAAGIFPADLEKKLRQLQKRGKNITDQDPDYPLLQELVAFEKALDGTKVKIQDYVVTSVTALLQEQSVLMARVAALQGVDIHAAFADVSNQTIDAFHPNYTVVAGILRFKTEVENEGPRLGQSEVSKRLTFAAIHGEMLERAGLTVSLNEVTKRVGYNEVNPLSPDFVFLEEVHALMGRMKETDRQVVNATEVQKLAGSASKYLKGAERELILMAFPDTDPVFLERMLTILARSGENITIRSEYYASFVALGVLIPAIVAAQNTEIVASQLLQTRLASLDQQIQLLDGAVISDTTLVAMEAQLTIPEGDVRSLIQFATGMLNSPEGAIVVGLFPGYTLNTLREMLQSLRITNGMSPQSELYAAFKALIVLRGDIQQRNGEQKQAYQDFRTAMEPLEIQEAGINATDEFLEREEIDVANRILQVLTRVGLIGISAATDAVLVDAAAATIFAILQMVVIASGGAPIVLAPLLVKALLVGLGAVGGSIGGFVGNNIFNKFKRRFKNK